MLPGSVPLLVQLLLDRITCRMKGVRVYQFDLQRPWPPGSRCREEELDSQVSPLEEDSHRIGTMAKNAARSVETAAMVIPIRRSKRLRTTKVENEEVCPAAAVTPDAAQSSCETVSSSTATRPTPEECQWVVDVLSRIHPDVVERNSRRRDEILSTCGMQDSIADGVVSTILSQNTTSANSTAAFRNLKKVFPTWKIYMETEDNATKLEAAINCGGLAQIKAARIHAMMSTLQEERGSPSLEYLRDLSKEEIKAELNRFKGLGPKTISCVLLFAMGRDEFPVDTHVHRISKQNGWVSASTNAEDTYLHLNHVVPDPLKLDLHCLLIAHGKSCYRCAARGKPQFPPSERVLCPLVHIHKQKGLVCVKDVAIKKDVIKIKKGCA